MAGNLENPMAIGGTSGSWPQGSFLYGGLSYSVECFMSIRLSMLFSFFNLLCTNVDSIYIIVYCCWKIVLKFSLATVSCSYCVFHSAFWSSFPALVDLPVPLHDVTYQCLSGQHNEHCAYVWRQPLTLRRIGDRNHPS